MEYNSYRRKSRPVFAGKTKIGGDAPILVQSMLCTDPHDANACIAMCRALEEAGCGMIRMTVPDKEAVGVIAKIKEAGISVPLVADIHFDYRLALEACAAGIDKIRINPGNIGAPERVRAVAAACAARRIPIRIGVNSGSLEKHLLVKYGAPTPQALAQSALWHAALLEQCDFTDIVLSVKASDVRTMIAANRILAQKCDYPLHLGVTEAGTRRIGSLKSAAGIGALLADGIGDTIRVSLTDDPVCEVEDARAVLEAMELLPGGVIHVVSCPTCGRTKIPLIALVNEFERRAKEEIHRKTPLKVAIMGCIVNGPGEAREADIGLAGGTDEAVIFRGTQMLCRVSPDKAIDTLLFYIGQIPEKS